MTEFEEGAAIGAEMCRRGIISKLESDLKRLNIIYYDQLQARLDGAASQTSSEIAGVMYALEVIKRDDRQ